MSGPDRAGSTSARTIIAEPAKTCSTTLLAVAAPAGDRPEVKEAQAFPARR